MKTYAQKRATLRPQRSFMPRQVQPQKRPLKASEKARQASEPSSSGYCFDFSQIPIRARTPPKIQSKPTINEPGDIYEQEADRVAEQVTRTPEAPLSDSAHERADSSPRRTALQPRQSASAHAPALQRQIIGLTNDAEVGSDAGGDVPRDVIVFLRLREGWRTDVYLDSVGKPTVGMGHLLTPGENQQYSVGDIVPDGILNQWARRDAKRAYDAALVQASMVGVTDPDFVKALTAVNFQLGTNWNRKHRKTWAHLLAHEWDNAAAEAQNSVWYQQTPIRVQDLQSSLHNLQEKKSPQPDSTQQSAQVDSSPSTKKEETKTIVPHHFYLRARDGSGLFFCRYFRGDIVVETNNKGLFETIGVRKKGHERDVILAQYPRGYRYFYRGSENVRHLFAFP